jgi:glycosidase
MPESRPHDLAVREFHISREARDRYRFEKTLYSLTGNVLFADFHAARVFAQRMNERRDVVNFPERAVRAGQINAMGLIDEILHYVVGLYREQRNPEVMADALTHLEEQVGREALDEALLTFVEEFPPVSVYQGELTPEEYLAGETEDVAHRRVALEEMLMLWLANANPAFAPFMELFDDDRLEKNTVYPQIIGEMREYLKDKPPFGPENEDLMTMLRSPAVAEPHSLNRQLEFIRTRWASLLGKYLYRLLSSLDFLEEEEKAFFGFGPGPVRPYEFGALEEEGENFSPDSEWMPRLVLIAKNVYVWLDQLSKEYERSITQLDEVPDEELDKLGRWGITGLWLIGIWERSEASKKIKQIMGNPEAVASAYSLKDYRIADDLGGEAAFENLKARAWRRGIRMASDMVPNHMGIDSNWVLEHPDWFIDLPHTPFPSYAFTGPDLADDDRVGIYIEDGYYNHTDAAVVFKRVDHWTGDERYIYHGNDGTSMPWNDTAQLDFLLEEVREAVIRTILDVARRSPIIRFDAAMTLAKKHYQRLWFPQPGTGGDIPSRSSFAMTKEEFNEAMPHEFWRQVVDRVAEEVPDTLLLAEAFWLMEGYFVRTLGMHRVYNSAFMNMMRDEKNDEYRQLIKNTLEFDPQILKRYVNFMNNPDERTAVDQYGKGDKYFGIATMMSTMPGLPMFGHGQVEGYTEKYGMEFRRAYWDETPDPYLVERHERQIFPLLHKRYLFAEVDDFLLYDFYTPEGQVDENVFAYSNKAGDERSLVLYHNRYAETRGWVRTSVAYAVKGDDGEKQLVQKSLAEGLGVSDRPGSYLIFRDAISGLEYIRSGQELREKGLYAQLHAYQSHVFVDFREVHDDEWHRYAHLTDYLNGRGVPSIEEAMKELHLEPIHAPLRMLVSAPAFRWLMDARVDDPDEEVDERVLEQVEDKMRDLLEAVAHLTRTQDGEVTAIAEEVRERLHTILSLPAQARSFAEAHADDGKTASEVQEALLSNSSAMWGTLFAWLFTHRLGKVVGPQEYAEVSRSWIDEWLLGKIIANSLQELGLDEGSAWRRVALVKVLVSLPTWFEGGRPDETLDYRVVHAMLSDVAARSYLGVNRYQDILWFNRESFEQLLRWILLLLKLLLEAEPDAAPVVSEEAAVALVSRLRKAESESDYQVQKLLEAVKDVD